tara:strand:+ start:796 stop:1011 length:216 start_codon:yes stop_codon:yes gene_type:complete
MTTDSLERRNELELVKIKGELKLMSEKIEVLKSNDIHHLQKSIDTMSKVLWGVGFLITGQLVIAVRLAIWP